MPHVSRRKLEKKKEDQLIDTLKLLSLKMHDKKEISVFFDSLITHTEQLMLAKRLAIIIMLDAGISDSKIAESLNVTRVTVEKMRFVKEAKGEGFDVALKKLNGEKLMQELKKLLLGFAKYSAKAAGGRL